MSIGSLLSMPAADGLFRRAILQSGAARPVMSIETAQRVAKIFAATLGVAPTRHAIASEPIDRLLQAQLDVEADLAADPDPERWGYEVAVSMMPWQPVVDGEVIPALPIERIAAGASAHVDVMAGSNLDENRLFMMVGDAIDRVTPEGLAGLVTAYGLPLERTLATYRAAHPGASPGDLFAAVQTDWFWRIPAIRLADAHANSPGATYMYEFAWRSPEYNGRLGAAHVLDVPFVFDILGNRTGLLLGPVPPQPLADKMHAEWVAFAKTGRCSWPRYDLERRRTMRFDVTSQVLDDPRSVERALWGGVGEPLEIAAASVHAEV
jgi:carboxylesterase type B